MSDDEPCDCGAPECEQVNKLILRLEVEMRARLGAEDEA